MASSRPSPSMRLEVARRAGGLCEYCRSPDTFASDIFQAEHVHPTSKGGPTELENLAWACGGCNLFKSSHTDAVDPASGNLVELFDPRIDDWNSHFLWAEDFLKLLGNTAKGRATISTLRMNRPSVVNLRSALLAIGRHPPADDPWNSG